MEFLEVEDLTRIYSHVIRGQVLSVDVKWTDDHRSIFTVVKVRVDETFKVTLAKSQIMTINQIGGEIDGSRFDYVGRPQFTVGENLVLFTGEPELGNFVVT